jgi:hypothetical protein
MTDESILDFIEKSHWIFAKTYAKFAPHEYTLKKNCDEQKFMAFARHIREFGKDETFKGKSYRYFDVAGRKYWTMDSDVEATILINRSVMPTAEQGIPNG